MTKDEITLCHYADASGNEKREIFRLGYIKAISQGGKKNSIDSAIIQQILAHEQEADLGQLLGETPFNFEARRSNCIIRTPSGTLSLICKGAFEEVSSLCTQFRLGYETVALNSELLHEFTQRVTTFNSDGHRVIVVATKDIPDHELVHDEYQGFDQNMTVESLLTFLDPPKDDAKASIQPLQQLGVDVRILTGGNLIVALKVCRTLGVVQEVTEEGILCQAHPPIRKVRAL